MNEKWSKNNLFFKSMTWFHDTQASVLMKWNEIQHSGFEPPTSKVRDVDGWQPAKCKATFRTEQWYWSHFWRAIIDRRVFQYHTDNVSNQRSEQSWLPYQLYLLFRSIHILRIYQYNGIVPTNFPRQSSVEKLKSQSDSSEYEAMHKQSLRTV